MIKWPQKQNHGYFKNGNPIETDYEQGWNHCIDSCRAAVEEACGREALAEMFYYLCTGESTPAVFQWKNLSDIGKAHFFMYADAIRRHLGLKDS